MLRVKLMSQTEWLIGYSSLTAATLGPVLLFTRIVGASRTSNLTMEIAVLDKRCRTAEDSNQLLLSLSPSLLRTEKQQKQMSQQTPRRRMSASNLPIGEFHDY